MHGGKYKVLTLIGQGTYGRVYKCEVVETNQVVVIKQMLLDGETDSEDILNEAKVMSQLQHKHIIQYYESFIENHALHIVMELAKHGDLYQVIQTRKKKPFEEEVLWNYLVQLFEGLSYLHSKRILHRDLKPQNIFMASASMVKIGDLGLGRILGSQTVQARSGVGTPLYFSPELCQDMPYDERSDVWALGCLFYELMTFSPPFLASNQIALAKKIVSEQPPALPTMYSPELRFLVMQMLQKPLKKRPTIIQLMNYAPVKYRMAEKQLKEKERDMHKRFQDVESHLRSEFKAKYTQFVADQEEVVKEMHTATQKQENLTRQTHDKLLRAQKLLTQKDDECAQLRAERGQVEKEHAETEALIAAERDAAREELRAARVKADQLELQVAELILDKQTRSQERKRTQQQHQLQLHQQQQQQQQLRTSGTSKAPVSVAEAQEMLSRSGSLRRRKGASLNSSMRKQVAESAAAHAAISTTTPALNRTESKMMGMNDGRDLDSEFLSTDLSKELDLMDYDEAVGLIGQQDSTSNSGGSNSSGGSTLKVSGKKTGKVATLQKKSSALSASSSSSTAAAAAKNSGGGDTTVSAMQRRQRERAQAPQESLETPKKKLTKSPPRVKRLPWSAIDGIDSTQATTRSLARDLMGVVTHDRDGVHTPEVTPRGKQRRREGVASSLSSPSPSSSSSHTHTHTAGSSDSSYRSRFNSASKSSSTSSSSHSRLRTRSTSSGGSSGSRPSSSVQPLRSTTRLPLRQQQQQPQGQFVSASSSSSAAQLRSTKESKVVQQRSKPLVSASYFELCSREAGKAVTFDVLYSWRKDDQERETTIVGSESGYAWDNAMPRSLRTPRPSVLVVFSLASEDVASADRLSQIEPVMQVQYKDALQYKVLATPRPIRIVPSSSYSTLSHSRKSKHTHTHKNKTRFVFDVAGTLTGFASVDRIRLSFGGHNSLVDEVVVMDYNRAFLTICAQPPRKRESWLLSQAIPQTLSLLSRTPGQGLGPPVRVNSSTATSSSTVHPKLNGKRLEFSSSSDSHTTSESDTDDDDLDLDASLSDAYASSLHTNDSDSSPFRLQTSKTSAASSNSSAVQSVHSVVHRPSVHSTPVQRVGKQQTRDTRAMLLSPAQVALFEEEMSRYQREEKSHVEQQPHAQEGMGSGGRSSLLRDLSALLQ